MKIQIPKPDQLYAVLFKIVTKQPNVLERITLEMTRRETAMTQLYPNQVDPDSKWGLTYAERDALRQFKKDIQTGEGTPEQKQFATDLIYNKAMSIDPEAATLLLQVCAALGYHPTKK